MLCDLNAADADGTRGAKHDDALPAGDARLPETRHRAQRTVSAADEVLRAAETAVAASRRVGYYFDLARIQPGETVIDLEAAVRGWTASSPRARTS
jgi:hypothetical protein